jgi:hypothetical protein
MARRRRAPRFQVERLACKCGALVVTATRDRLVHLLGKTGGLECMCGRVLVLSASNRPVWLDAKALRIAFAALKRVTG